MYTPYKYILCLFTVTITTINISTTLATTLKIWRPPSRTTAAAWQPVGAQTECARHTFVYQADGHIESIGVISQSLKPLPVLRVERVVLPSTGVLLLDENTPIQFGGRNGACKPNTPWRDYTMQTRLGHEPVAWYDPAAWQTDDAGGKPTANAARVHVDRVPCACDAVQLAGTNRSAGLQLGIRLRDGDGELRVGDVQLNGQSGDIGRLLSDRVAGAMFEAPVYKSLRSFGPRNVNSGGVDAVGNSNGCLHRQPCECHDADNYDSVLDAVCGNVVCPADACLQPVRVEGACCPVCGAVFETVQHEHQQLADEQQCPPIDRIRSEVQRLLRRLDDGRWLDLVDFDVSVVAKLYADPTTGRHWTERKGKLVLADRGDDYRGHSSELAELLWQQDTMRMMFREPQIAGPAHRAGTAAPLGSLLVGTLLLVLGAYGLLYAHYERRWLDAPLAIGARAAHRFVGGRAATRFQRFDNVSLAGGLATMSTASQRLSGGTMAVKTAHDNDDDGADGVGALVRAAAIADTSPTTAFDNPLFRASGTAIASSAGGVVVVGSGVEELNGQRRFGDGPTILNDVGKMSEDTNAHQVAEMGIECENLIDVDLDSSETTHVF